MRRRQLIRNKRILILSDSYPYPPTDGRKLRIYGLFKQFAEGYRFDYLTFGETNVNGDPATLKHQLGALCDNVEIINSSTLQKNTPMGFMARVKNILYPYVDTIGPSRYSDKMRSKVKEKLDSESYDLLIVCGLYSMLYIDKSSIKIPYIVDIVDSMSLLFRSYLENEWHHARKFRFYLNYIWATRYEKLHCSQLSNIIMCTSVDSDIIKRHCPYSNVWTVPEGVDTEYYRSKRASSLGKNLLFTGVMNYPPNNTAMLHFIENIFPLIRQTDPDIVLTIAGKNPTPELQLLANRTAGIILTGFVDDMRPYFDAATVYVSPLVTGAGMKNKILEAWAMSLPVIATSLSCSGIEAIANENILIADKPREFAEKVLGLLQDEALRSRLSRCGRETAEQLYSWQNRSNMIRDIIDNLLNQKR
jgi:glycosyltransferase involved in cell wall biosynthesis